MFAQIATFLIDTVVSFLVFLLLARFHFQWLRVPFRNPMGEFLLATTSWIVLPARRVVPGLAGLDLATLLIAWLLQALGLWAQAWIAGAEPSALAVALIEFLAAYFGVPKRNVRIAAGLKSRRKRVVIEGAQWTAKRN